MVSWIYYPNANICIIIITICSPFFQLEVEKSVWKINLIININYILVLLFVVLKQKLHWKYIFFI